MSSEAEGSHAIFARRGWLSTQPPSFIDTILSRGRVKHLERDQTVYREGDAPGGIFGILSGGIGIVVGPPRLSPRVGHILRAGWWFGSGPILRGGERSMGFKATEPSTLLVVLLPSLKIPATDEGDVALRAAGIADIGAQLGADVAADLMIPVSARRLAAVLVRVTAADDGITPDHPDGFLLPQTLVADMANISRNLANRILREFRLSGWIAVRYNRIRILDVEALSEFAYADE